MAMKTAKYLMTFVLFIGLIIPFAAHADDTSIYDIAQDVKPNVLIIFDNSGSMDTIVPYTDTVTYVLIDPPNKYLSNTIYEYSCTNWWWDRRHRRYVCQGWDWVVSSITLEDFENNHDANNDGIYDTDSNIKKGNRLNYDLSSAEAKYRITLAKQAVKNVIGLTKDYVRFGIMVLNAQQDINVTHNYSTYHNDTTVLSATYGGAEIADRDDAGVSTLMDQLSNLDADGGTPLANRLINVAKYFRGTGGFKDKDNNLLPRPLDNTNWCRKNFVIIMTDGLPEGEGDSYEANAVGEYDDIEGFLPDFGHPRHWDYDNDGKDPDPTNRYVHGGSDYLDDVAKYLHDTDDSLDPGHTITGNQNLTVYTIGFTIDDPLLSDTAANGGGQYYTANDADELAQALLGTLISIISQTQTFTAPVVPVERTTSGSDMYVSLFTPKSDNFWPGYLVKLHIGNNGELLGYASDYGEGDEVAVTGSNGVLSENLVKPTESPYPAWDAQYKLTHRTEPRNIYTYLGTSTNLTDSSNAFNSTNITDELLGGHPERNPNAQTGSDTRIDLINFVIGLDSYDSDKDHVYYDEKRDTILGDILHSRPLIVDYSSTQRVIYVGTNDGMLHAFSDTDGSEKWGFIPPDLLPSLKYLAQGSTHPYFVDSSPKAYIKDVNHNGIIESGDDQVIIIFGERGGGVSYTALDVTHPDAPIFLWRIDNNPAGDYAAMGYTWSEPVIGKVKVDTEDKDVAIIGGGYDPDNLKGNAVYLVDVHDGSLVKSFTNSDDANLTKSIPSTVLAADTTFDGYINRLYVGDAGGQMWRFGLQRENSSDARAEDGNVSNWTPRRLFQATTSGRKIFYQPDLVLERGYAYLYFGTGDRDNPMLRQADAAPIDRLYAVKDHNENNDDFSTLGEGNLTDLTSNVLQNPANAGYAAKLAELNAKQGWFVQMTGDGEKVLASPVVFYGMVLFTTFIPNTDPCSYGGNARFYAADYLNATAVMDLDADGDIDENDRSKDIGHGIPTEAVVTISATGEANAYIGAGGGIILIHLPTSAGKFSIDSWRENF
jgi:type IV pilus assembly protein PilY1